MTRNPALHVVFAVIVGIALIGFASGTHPDDYDLHPWDPTATHGALPEPHVAEHAPAAAPEVAVARARSYRELRDTPRGQGSGWEHDVAGFALPDGAPVVGRPELRAYEGAPPRIPHAVRQDAAPECLACHAAGMTFRGRTAPATSHEDRTSCTQCHVVDIAPMPGGADLPADPRAVTNTFAGRPPAIRPGHGP